MQMSGRIVHALAAAAMLGVAGTALPHHSYPLFDRCEAFSGEGEIESMEWANPHVVLYGRSADASVYRVEWFSAFRLARSGIHDGALSVGDQVVISGSEHNDPEINIVTLRTEVRRPSGDWGWSRPFPVNASCTD